MALITLYVAVFFATDRLRFDPVRDETHFWPTTLRFAQQFPPSVELLRNYNELNTPLPFVVFGGLEHVTASGIAAGRLLNLLISFGIALLILLSSKNNPWRAARSCIGLLAFPYFLGSSVMLYTDIIAAGFVLCGVVMHERGRPWIGMLMFALAIASRQYTVAFPLAVAANELWLRFRNRHGNSDPARSCACWIAPLIAAMTLGGWYLFFGGPAPRPAIEAQQLASAQPSRLFPAHALYFLACIGAWFVIPEFIFFRAQWSLRSACRSPVAWMLGGMVIIGFVLSPPLSNVNYGVPSMGYLDKAARMALSDPVRMTLFAGLSLLAVCRFSRVNLAFFMMLANAVVMLKAHIGWDKYALPLVVVLWWLESRNALDEAGAFEGRLCSDSAGFVDDSHRLLPVVSSAGHG